jgi:hypothetical protein
MAGAPSARPAALADPPEDRGIAFLGVTSLSVPVRRSRVLGAPDAAATRKGCAPKPTTLVVDALRTYGRGRPARTCATGRWAAGFHSSVPSNIRIAPPRPGRVRPAAEPPASILRCPSNVRKAPPCPDVCDRPPSRWLPFFDVLRMYGRRRPARTCATLLERARRFPSMPPNIRIAPPRPNVCDRQLMPPDSGRPLPAPQPTNSAL